MTTTNARHFAAALTLGANHIPSTKVRLPILHCVRIEKNGCLTIASTDLEKWTEATVGASGADEWAICIPYKPLHDWLAVWADDNELRLSMNPRTQILTAEYPAARCIATFKGIDAAEYPARPAPELIDWPTIPAKSPRIPARQRKAQKLIDKAQVAYDKACAKSEQALICEIRRREQWDALPTAIAAIVARYTAPVYEGMDYHENWSYKQYTAELAEGYADYMAACIRQRQYAAAEVAEAWASVQFYQQLAEA